MQARFKDFDQSAVRFFDDLEYFATSRRQVEEVLQVWEAELAQFELVLNPDKTSIDDAPFATESAWHGELASMRIRETSEIAESNDILEFFDRAFALARAHPKDTVVNFAIRRFKDWTFSNEGWQTYLGLLLPAVIAEPSAIPHLTQALAFARAEDLEVPTSRLEETLNHLVDHHAVLAHAAETLWALWTLVENELPLDEGAANAVVAMGDTACALALRQLVDPARVDLAPLIERAEDPDATTNGDWLLSYEAARQGWARPDLLRKQAEFAELLDLGVAFFDPNARVAVEEPAEEY
jgi:hypothetical protein